MQTIVALAMLVRQFNFQLAVGAPPVSSMLFILYFFWASLKFLEPWLQTCYLDIYSQFNGVKSGNLAHRKESDLTHILLPLNILLTQRV